MGATKQAMVAASNNTHGVIVMMEVVDAVCWASLGSLLNGKINIKMR